MQIYDTKMWRDLTDKHPSEDQKKQIHHIQTFFKIKTAHIKILANFCKYNINDNWYDRLIKVLNFNLKYKSTHTREGYILKYGEEGNELYNSYIKKKSNTLQSFIRRYGEDEGGKKYKDFCIKNKKNKSVERFIEKYGDIEGVQKYREYKKREHFVSTREYYIQKYGNDAGNVLYDKKMSKLHHGATKKGFIEKYGYKEGIQKLSIAKNNTSLNAFKIKYGESLGVVKYNNFINKKRFNNTLEGYIQRYGIDEGINRYNKWLTQSAIGVGGVSKISQELFQNLDNINEKIYFGSKNKEYHIYDEHNKCSYFLDFINCDRKKVIEFNGDIFHGNPDIFKENDTPNPFIKKLTCKEIWEYDKIKHECIISKGLDILVIWEKDYKLDKNSIIEKCKKFIYD